MNHSVGAWRAGGGEVAVAVAGGGRSVARLLLLNGGDGFHRGVVQVVGGHDGQAALRQDPLGLVHVGS